MTPADVWIGFKITSALDALSHFCGAFVPLYVRVFNWSEDRAIRRGM